MNGLVLSRGRIGVKRVLKSILGVAGWPLRPRGPGLRVLFYHRVNPYPPARLGPVSREISVTPDAFERQLRHLAAGGWRGISLAECAAMLDGSMPLDPRALLITFDDGYEDNLLFAAPLLERYGFRATVFAVAGFLGRESGEVWPYGDTPGHGRFLDRTQLQTLVRSGFEIGSHTMTHPRLTEIDGPERARELGEARSLLEAAVAKPVTAFAYPEGDVDAAVEWAVSEAGYTLAFTTVPGRNGLGTRPTALRRTEVSASDSPIVFRMKLAGALDWLAFKESAGVRAVIGALNRRLIRHVRAGVS